MTKRNDPQPDLPQPEVNPAAPFTGEVDSIAPAMEPLVETDASAVANEPKVSTATAATPAPRRGPGVLAPLTGGVLAAALGFALSHFDLLGLASTDSAAVSDLSAQVAKLEQAQSGLEAKLADGISALSTRVASLESAPPPSAPDLSRLDAVDQRLAALEAVPTDGTASTAALSSKLAQLEQRLANLTVAPADPGLQQKLDDALQRLSDAEAAATASAEAADAQTRAGQRADALAKLGEAIATGEPFADKLTALGDPSLSNALSGAAAAGLPTLAQLQADFPDGAREVLRLSRDINSNDGWSDRIVDFLASQTEARPLVPLEGSTPEAILSRADFAVAEGRIADALTELDALDSALVAPLADWSVRANAYVAAHAALQAAQVE